MVGMNNTPVQEKRGLDPIAIAMQSVCMWAENQLKQKLGFNDLRWDGNIDNPRQGLKQGQMETEQSMNNTGYIFRMIEYMKQRICTSTLTKAQDIVKFKDTLPYNWIKNLLGVEDFENLKLLDKFAAHRYAIMFQNYNALLEKKTFMDLVYKSMDTGDGRGGISIIEAGMLLSTEDYKLGLRKLAYFKYKADKIKRKQELELLKVQQQNIMEQKAADKDLENMKIHGKLTETQMITNKDIAVAQITTKGKIDVHQMTQTNEASKQQSKADAEKQVIEKQGEVDNQKVLA
jgi:hypothetical protein